MAPSAPADAPSRRDRRQAETRGAIVAAARELFDERGYTETTVDQIAERADVAPRTFFRYFASKEALLFAGFDDVRRALDEALVARPATEHPLRSTIAALLELAPVVEERHEDLKWGFRICDEQDIGGAYQRTMIKAQMGEEVAAFLAERLGVDVDTDPRPHAWAMTCTALFGSAVRGALGGNRDRSVADTFRELLGETAATLREAIRRL